MQVFGFRMTEFLGQVNLPLRFFHLLILCVDYAPPAQFGFAGFAVANGIVIIAEQANSVGITFLVNFQRRHNLVKYCV